MLELEFFVAGFVAKVVHLKLLVESLMQPVQKLEFSDAKLGAGALRR